MATKNPKTSSSAKTKKPTTTKTQRYLKEAQYKSFSLQKKITPAQSGPALPSALDIFRSSIKLLRANWKLFGGIVLLFIVINLLFIKGLDSSSDVSTNRATFDSLFTGSFSHVMSSLATFAALVGTSGQSTSTSTGSYQFIWILISSLAFVWALREVFAGTQNVRIRDGYYRGMYPLIIVWLVLCVIAVQMIPFVVGGTIFSTVVANGIATTWVETAIWGLLFLLLATLSLYFVISSAFALYIACLPDMTPIVALKTARQLVANRRASVLIKILALPLILAIITLILLLPFLLFFPPAALWVFYVLTAFNFAVAHTYYYSLYRSLL